jgi:hypothetical protein
LTFEQIQQQYSDEWLLIAYKQVDPDTLQVIQGEVLAHSPDRQETYAALALAKGQDVAIEFVGEPQDDVAYTL